MTWHHPNSNYWKAIREAKRQAASRKRLQPEVASNKPQAPSEESHKPQAASDKQQAS